MLEKATKQNPPTKGGIFNLTGNIMRNNIKLTKAGLEALKKELAELLDVKRPKLVDRLANARSQGDLSENSDYQSAKEELEFLDGRIDELTEVVQTAVVADGSKNGDGVGVGTKVTVKVIYLMLWVIGRPIRLTKKFPTVLRLGWPWLVKKSATKPKSKPRQEKLCTRY